MDDEVYCLVWFTDATQKWVNMCWYYQLGIGWKFLNEIKDLRKSSIDSLVIHVSLRWLV